ncbi:MAG: phosphatase PAP2 family protein [Caldilineaceae bacterium]|nr:phosphatase PAP2 family protein [Caldilineaceae bacterium]
MSDWRFDLKQRGSSLWERIKRTELVILLAVALVVSGTWLFIQIADQVLEGETAILDEQILLALRNPADYSDPLGPPWVEEAMRDFTGLGGAGILIFLTASVIGYLLILRKYRSALLIGLAVVGGMILSQSLKSLFDRPRPDLVPHGSFVYFASFPSGHSMLSAATYLTIGALLARLQKQRRLKFYILGLAATITVLVGVSRVYLGVHWPTDVLAGWAAGAVWAAFCGLGMWWLQQRGKVEKTVAESSDGPAEEPEEFVASQH